MDFIKKLKKECKSVIFLLVQDYYNNISIGFLRLINKGEV